MGRAATEASLDVSVDAPQWFHASETTTISERGRPFSEKKLAREAGLDVRQAHSTVHHREAHGLGNKGLYRLESPHRRVSPDAPAYMRDGHAKTPTPHTTTLVHSLPRLSVRAYADKPTTAAGVASLNSTAASLSVPHLSSSYRTTSDTSELAFQWPEAQLSPSELLTTGASVVSVSTLSTSTNRSRSTTPTIHLPAFRRKYRLRPTKNAERPPFLVETNSFVNQTSDGIAVKTSGIRWPSPQTQAHREKPTPSWHAGVPAAANRSPYGERVETPWPRPQRERTPLLRKTLHLGRPDVEISSETGSGSMSYAGGKRAGALVINDASSGHLPSIPALFEDAHAVESSIHDVPSMKSSFFGSLDDAASAIEEARLPPAEPMKREGLFVEICSVEVDASSADRYEREADLLAHATGRVRLHVTALGSKGRIGEFQTTPSALDANGKVARWGVRGSGTRARLAATGADEETAHELAVAVALEHELDQAASGSDHPWVRTAYAQVRAGYWEKHGGLNALSSAPHILPVMPVQLAPSYGGRSARVQMRVVCKLA